jgi:molybdopterin-guanine dinucleotide biosynthesis protein A
MTVYEPPGAPGPPGTPGADVPYDVDVPYDAVVLAGGAARRLGGADKPGVRVGGRALLDRVLAACAGAATTVVVAAPRATARPVVWAREDPPGGGPLAALEAGLRHTTAEYVVVLSADLPFLEEETVRRLLATLRTGDAARDLTAPRTLESAPRDSGSAPPVPASVPCDSGSAPPVPASVPRTSASAPRDSASAVCPPASAPRDSASAPRDSAPAPHPPTSAPPAQADAAGPDGVLLTDPGGRDQPLVAAYRAQALRRELESLAVECGGLAGLPLRRLIAALDLTRITDPVASFDCDTWDDIAAARARIREHEHVLDEWISAVKDELGIDLDVDTGVLLDLARDAAHGVARPAAPLTTFLVGYAAARAGGGPEAVAEAARKAAALALRWADEDAAASDAKPDAG